MVYYYLHPAEFQADLKKILPEYSAPIQSGPETLGFIAELAAFAAPIIQQGIGILFQVKGAEAVNEGQEKVLAAQAAMMQTQYLMQESSQAATGKMVSQVLLFAGAGLVLYLVLK
jgi:hypothetical protein